MFRHAIAALFAVFVAMRADACTPRTWGPDELVENTPVYSANGRFCVVMRWWDGVPDFHSERAGKVLHLDDENFVPPDRPDVVIAALYEVSGTSRRLAAEIPIANENAGPVLVPDSGRAVVTFLGVDRACGGSGGAGDPLVAIYRTDGYFVGRLTIGDVLTPYDVVRVPQNSSDGVEASLRLERDGREVVVLAIRGPGYPADPPVERRVDLQTATLLDAKVPIFPAPHVFVSAPNSASPFRDRVIDEPAVRRLREDLVWLAAPTLLRQAFAGPLPPFPPVALKARIRGTVIVEVVVSEMGDVIETQVVKPLPFGLDTAAVEAARRWKFLPYTFEGRGVKFAGSLYFRFLDVDDETFRVATQNAPP